MKRTYRHNVRLSKGEEGVAQEVMKVLECKSIPEMFRMLLDHTQMPDDLEHIGDSGLTARPPMWRYALRVQENEKLRALLEKICNAIRSRNS